VRRDSVGAVSDLSDLVLTVSGAGTTEERLAAEREVCAQLAPRLRLYGLRHLKDDAAAADLVQDALIVLIEAMRAGRIESPQLADRFVLGTCRNLVSRRRRNQRRQQAFEETAVPLSVAELPPAYSGVDATRLAMCLGQLAPKAQRVVLATFQEERSAAEIATELATSAGNVRVLRHRAMTTLQLCIEGAA